MEAAEEIGDGFDFLNMDATWAEPYHDNESPSPSLAASESTALAEERGQRTQDEKPQIQTLLIMTDWARTEAEKFVSDSGRIEDHSTSAVLTAGNILERVCCKRPIFIRTITWCLRRCPGLMLRGWIRKKGGLRM